MKRLVALVVAVSIPVAVLAVVLTGCCLAPRHRCDGVARMLVNDHHATGVAAKAQLSTPAVAAAPSAPPPSATIVFAAVPSEARAERDTGPLQLRI